MRTLLSYSILLTVAWVAGFACNYSLAGDHWHPGVEKICRYLGVGYSHRGYHVPPRNAGAAQFSRSEEMQEYRPATIVQQRSMLDELPASSPPLNSLHPCVPKATLPSWTQTIPADAEQLPSAVPDNSSPAPELPSSGHDDGLLLLLNSWEGQRTPKVSKNRYRQWEHIDQPLLK